MLRLGIVVAFIVYLILLAGQVSDLVNDRGSRSGIYIETGAAGEVRISGFRTGVAELGGLETGDVILRLGDADEHGVDKVPTNYFAFRHALDAADGNVLIQRDGHTFQTRYDLERYLWQAVVVLRNVALGVLAAVLLIYSSGSLAQTAAVTFLLMSAWGQGAPIGGSGEATALFTLVWCIGQSFVSPMLGILFQRVM